MFVGKVAPIRHSFALLFISTRKSKTKTKQCTYSIDLASNYGAILVMFVIPSLAKDSTYIPMVVSC